MSKGHISIGFHVEYFLIFTFLAGCVATKALPNYPESRRSLDIQSTTPAPHEPTPPIRPSISKSMTGGLVLQTAILDQDGNNIFEPNEQVVLRVTLRNGTDEDFIGASLILKGSPILVNAIRNPKAVGDLVAGTERVVTMTGILPEHFPPQSGDLQVLLHGSNGQVLSTESLSLTISSRTATDLPRDRDSEGLAPTRFPRPRFKSGAQTIRPFTTH
jgi:hypothetical protein